MDEVDTIEDSTSGKGYTISRNGLRAKALTRVAEQYEIEGFDKQSENTFNKALNIIQTTLPQKRDVIFALGDLTRAYIRSKRYDEAIKIRQTFRDVYDVADLVHNYIDTKQYDRALKVIQEIKDSVLATNSLVELAQSYIDIGQSDKALTTLDRAIEVIQSIQPLSIPVQPEIQLDLLLQLAEQYSTIGAHDRVWKIVEIIKRNGYQNNALLLKAVEHSKMGDFDQALIQLSAIQQPSNRRIQALSEIAEAAAVGGQVQRSFDILVEALKIDSELTKANQLSSWGEEEYQANHFREAISFEQQAVGTYKRLQETAKEADSLQLIGLSHYKTENLEAAVIALNSALQIREANRTLEKLIRYEDKQGDIAEGDIAKRADLNLQAPLYILLQKILISQKKYNVSLDIAERGRAPIFSDSLIAKLSPSLKSILITGQQSALQQAQSVAKSQNSTVVYYSFLYDLEDYTASLNSETDLASQLLIWVVKASGEWSFRQVSLNKQELKYSFSVPELAASSRSSVGVVGRSPSITLEPVAGATEQGKPKKRLRNLYNLLIQPIADLLPQDPKIPVIFIPQGELFLVPFPALQDAKGQYLIEKHTILTAPSLKVLDITHLQNLQRKKHSENANNNLVVGNPTMPRLLRSKSVGRSIVYDLLESQSSLAPLLGAEKEAILVADLLHTTPIIGAEATIETVLAKMPQAQIIHLATHGLADYLSFEKAGYAPGSIAFAPSDNNPSSLLDSESIFRLQLNADLVTLSACDTGRGLFEWDGVVGLSRSFIIAGASSVIVSLWSVPDAPTAELMVEFYRNWREKKMDKAQALRQAMLTTMKTHPSPRDWAAFTLIGESD